MKVGLYGGSFDPIHAGHVLPVVEALEALDLERVIYLPTAHPPHKGDRQLAPPLARFAMVELALLDHPRLWVSPFEIESPPPTYTVDTIEHFRRRMPEARLFLLLGSDSLHGLPTWHRWRRLADLAELAVMVRPGWLRSRDLPAEVAPLVTAGRVHFVANTPVDASSTDLRRRLAAGERPAGGQLAPRVLDYVGKYRLYQS